MTKFESLELPDYETATSSRFLQCPEPATTPEPIRHHTIPLKNRHNAYTKCGIFTMITTVWLIGIVLMAVGDTSARKKYEVYKNEKNEKKYQEAIAIFDSFEKCLCTLQETGTSTKVECPSTSFTRYHGEKSGNDRPYVCFNEGDGSAYSGSRKDWIKSYVFWNGESRDFDFQRLPKEFSYLANMSYIGFSLFLFSLILFGCCCYLSK